MSQPSMFPYHTSYPQPLWGLQMVYGGYFLSAQNTSRTIANESLWARGNEGFRTQWLMGGLTPFTNYIAFVLQNNTKVSGPIFFMTKSCRYFFRSTLFAISDFTASSSVLYLSPCSLFAFLPRRRVLLYRFLPQRNFPRTDYHILTLLHDQFLHTFACGRDWYSPLVVCDDCQREYRKMALCYLIYNMFRAQPSISRCLYCPAPLLPVLQASTQPVQILFFLLCFLNKLGSPYNMPLRCLEMCNAVDPFVQITCPIMPLRVMV